MENTDIATEEKGVFMHNIGAKGLVVMFYKTAKEQSKPLHINCRQKASLYIMKT